MFEATARLHIRGGELDGFEDQAAEVMRLTHEKDTRPLRYDWFVSEDGTECEVREAYVDADALVEQQRSVGEAKAKLFHDHTAGHSMEFYGEPSPSLAQVLKAMAVDFTQFSFFQGLNAETDPLSSASGGGREVFEAAARLKVREGELDGFKRQAAEIMRQTKDRDTKTLRYDWFIDDAGSECVVREAYVDADGLLEHHHHIAEAKAKLFRDFADGHQMTFYGEPSPALAEATKAIPGVEITQFSFFQGLGAGGKVGANRQLLERYVELYNAGDLDACMDLYAEDAVQLMHDGTFEGPTEIHERLARDLIAFPDATYTVESFVEHGDAFADEWTFVGTHNGPFRLPDGTELAPTGTRVEVRGMELVQLRDGKIVVDNLYYDSMAVVAQLGLVPEPVPA